MQYCNKFYKMRYRKALKGLQRAVYKADIDATAQEREKVILFYQKHGYKLTQEAFGVKRYTLLNWQRKYKELAIIGLINRDRASKRKRQSVISQEIKDFIKEYAKNTAIYTKTK